MGLDLILTTSTPQLVSPRVGYPQGPGPLLAVMLAGRAGVSQGLPGILAGERGVLAGSASLERPAQPKWHALF